MRMITGDRKKVKGRKSEMPLFCVGAGRAHEVLRAGFIEHLEELQRACSFRYMRFHGIFLDDMDVYREDKEGNPIYNWQCVDEAYDRMLQANIRPLVELSFMPWDMACGDQSLCWWRGNVTQPEDFEKWYRLVKEFTAHVTERYGEEEIRQWLFEVWNEPNHPSFFKGTQEDYFKLYEYSVRAVKEVCTEYKVGGPATAGNVWIEELIQFCDERKLPLDFVTSHDYGCQSGFDEFGERLQTMDEDPDYIINHIREVHKKVRSSVMPELPIYYTEWSSSYSSRDNVHDSYIQAPYILYNLKRLEGYADAMSYWAFTDVFEEAGPSPTPFHGGFGLINQQGVKKPAFYAYEYLGRLGETELVNEDSDSYICDDGRNTQVLFWNYTHQKQDTVNQRYFTRDLPASDAGEVRIVLTGLEPGYYAVKLSGTGYKRNDVYTDYLAMGRPSWISREAVKELKEHNNGAPLETEILYIDGSFEKIVPMRENDVYLLELNKI